MEYQNNVISYREGKKGKFNISFIGVLNGEV